MNEALIRRFLSLEDHPLRVRIDARHVEDLVHGYLEWPGAYSPAHDAKELPEPAEGRVLLRYLGETLANLTDRVGRLEASRARTLARADAATHPREQTDLVLDFAKELGSTGRRMRGDRAALRRWFDLGAVLDRCDERRAAHEQRLAIVLRRVGPLSAWLLRQEVHQADTERTWRELELERLLFPVLTYPGDARVRLEAFRALLEAISALPPHLHQGCLSDQTVRFVYRAAISREEPLWVQREALTFLPAIDPETFGKALGLRILDPVPGDDFFVRCRAVKLLGERFERVDGARELLERAVSDPSPRVRQAVAAAAERCWSHGGREVLARLLREDPAPPVRAAALLALEAPGRDAVRREDAHALLDGVLASEATPFVVRTALHVLERLAGEPGHGVPTAEETALAARFLPVLEELHTSHPSLSVRRWAAQTREHLWCRSHRDVEEALARVRELQAATREGESRPAPDLGLSGTRLGRALATAARRDFGLSFDPGPETPLLARGDRFRFRAWRFLHELRNPDPAKRQGHSHVVGRSARGAIRAPSGVLGELAETKVPGEPRFLASEDGWRPYLPLPDDAVSLLDLGCDEEQVSFFTAEGITDLVRPAGARRWRARLALALGFASLARARNWQEGDSADPSTYVKRLGELGFSCRFRPFREEDGLATRPDPAVTRFFPALAVPPVLYERLRNAQDYFFSAYGNTLSDLLLFTLGVSALFYGRNVVRHQQLRRHRRRIPVVIGGWGTRGKSGTERLKAAMLSGLGYGVVCKTTGCESMFLYGKPFQSLQEMFLFRPYDKASIHEQAFVVSMASRLGTDVFLWECMALSPPLVKILQRQWMHDDLSTLTNAFPDHEDVQGPAGHDIPRVMTSFIPRRRVLYTSEENMLPILADGAREMETAVRRVTWLESGLLTSDVLGRFRFQEHPDNVALVLAIAEDLGVDRDYAVKEMADRVVADLGVLKTFPEADVAGRRLRFTNGMSANEPFGALSNWKRVGFAEQDPETAPGEWITAVVNNRADRVARSHVFAQLVAEELPADRYFLIGGNLTGLQGYLRDAIRKATDSISLSGDRRRAEEVLLASARRFRLCVAPEQVAARVAAMLTGVGAPLPADPSTLAQASGLERALGGTEHERWLAEMEPHRAAWSESVREVRELLGRIRDPRIELRPLDEEVRGFLARSFERKLQVVDDYFAPGDKLVEIVATATPPGFRNRCMGIQNIKGTGLDFVYRFLAWESCHALCERVLDRDDAAVLKALDELSSFRDFGLLSEAKVRDTLDRCAERSAFQPPPVRDQLARLRTRLDERLAAVREGIARSGAPGLKDRVLSLVETLLDTLDGLHRRRTAARIYRDILAGRISRLRAMDELRRLTKRQYGGWLRGKA